MKQKKKRKVQKHSESTSDIQKLANRLKSLRIQRGFTSYEAFANEFGLSRALYGRYEKGKDLRYSSLIKIVTALDMTLEEFFSEGFD
jgi:transcriptional regulator with XRE-family HTH domain